MGDSLPGRWWNAARLHFEFDYHTLLEIEESYGTPTLNCCNNKLGMAWG